MESTTLYCCTLMDKMAQEDVYESGCVPDDLHCVMSEKCNLRADTLEGLLEKIRDTYFLSLDDLYLPTDDYDSDEDVLEYFGFSRLETADSYEPSESDMELWKKGILRLWLCDYTFHIEKQIVSSVTIGELRACNIKTH